MGSRVGGGGCATRTRARISASIAASLIFVACGSRVSGGAAPSVPATAAASGHAAAAERAGPRTDVLGVRIGMRDAEAQRRLALLGSRNEENEEAENEGEGEPVSREIWTLRGTDIRYVLIGVDGEKRVVSLQAFARPGGRGIRYRDVGSFEQARRLGFYIYEWYVPGKDGAPGLRVEARGTDPEYLGNYMVMRDRRGSSTEEETAAPDSGR